MMDLPARQKAISLPGDLSNTKFGFVNIQAGHKKPCEVLLIDMPFGLLFSPSLGLSLLRASLKATNVQSKILYFTFRFAERIGTALYLRLQPAMNSLVGEWVFADSIFESARLNQKQYVDEILTRRLAKYKDLLEQTEEIPDRYVEEILNIREQTSEFLDDCLNDVLAYKPLIVGFTSVFQQHVSSLALAKRIKERAPETFILFGGANCEGVMGAELLRQFGFVDTVVSGEADQIFAEIVRRVLDGKSLNGLQGLFTNAERQTPPSKLSAPMIQNMDALPLVDYDDYMSQFERSRLDQKYIPWIPVETSRGCWWGETLHCTFCGLNG